MPSTTNAPPSATTPHLHWEPIPSSLLREIYESDQAIYPAPELTLTRLQSWATAYPDLCLCLRRGHHQEPPPPQQQQQQQQQQDQEQTINNPNPNHGSDILGVMIVLPLQQSSWDFLLSATIKEHDVDPSNMFPSSNLDRCSQESPAEKEAEKDPHAVGLHVFHVERFATGNAAEPGWDSSKRFTDLALAEIQQRVAEKFGTWDVAGWSALTATPQGHRAFQRVGFSIKYLETDDGITSLDESAEESSLNLPKPVIARMMVRSGNDSF